MFYYYVFLYKVLVRASTPNHPRCTVPVHPHRGVQTAPITQILQNQLQMHQVKQWAESVGHCAPYCSAPTVVCATGKFPGDLCAGVPLAPNLLIGSCNSRAVYTRVRRPLVCGRRYLKKQSFLMVCNIFNILYL